MLQRDDSVRRVVIEGVSGIGKSMLADQAANEMSETLSKQFRIEVLQAARLFILYFHAHAHTHEHAHAGTRNTEHGTQLQLVSSCIYIPIIIIYNIYIYIISRGPCVQGSSEAAFRTSFLRLGRDHLGVRDPDPSTALSSTRERLEDGRGNHWLLVVDDLAAKTVDVANTFLPKSSCRVLFTTRDIKVVESLESCIPVSLGTFDWNESEELLRKVGAPRQHRVQSIASDIR